MKILTKDVYMLMQRVGNLFKREDKIELDSIMNEYYNHISETENKLPKEKHELFNLHDSKLIRLLSNNNSIEMLIDSENSYTDVHKLIFSNVSKYNFNMSLVNAWILYSELYIEKGQYNFQLLLYIEENTVLEIQIISDDISLL
ncbi:DUF4085 family protein [Mycoplasmatota bacterium WC30]